MIFSQVLTEPITHQNMSSSDSQAFQTIALGLVGQYDTLDVINFFGNSTVELEDIAAKELEDFEKAVIQYNTTQAIEIVSRNCVGINPRSLNLFSSDIPES